MEPQRRGEVAVRERNEAARHPAHRTVDREHRMDEAQAAQRRAVRQQDAVPRRDEPRGGAELRGHQPGEPEVECSSGQLHGCALTRIISAMTKMMMSMIPSTRPAVAMPAPP